MSTRMRSLRWSMQAAKYQRTALIIPHLVVWVGLERMQQVGSRVPLRLEERADRRAVLGADVDVHLPARGW